MLHVLFYIFTNYVEKAVTMCGASLTSFSEICGLDRITFCCGDVLDITASRKLRIGQKSNESTVHVFCLALKLVDNSCNNFHIVVFTFWCMHKL